MKRALFVYGLGVAGASFLLAWIEYQYLTRAFTTEIYIVLIAAGFTALGLWAGGRLAPERRPEGFRRNDAALLSLGVTPREHEILSLLSAGRSNKEIARDLALSPNTVKTHVSNLYAKLGARRRTEAVDRARSLALIP